jgi:uncharacterized membrane-anchored protein YhcB (DUF1043 family)
MKDWANWQEISFGLAVLFLVFGTVIAVANAYFKYRKPKEQTSQPTNDILLKVLEGYEARSRESAEGYAQMAAAINEMNITQRETRQHIAQLSSCVERIDLRVGHVETGLNNVQQVVNDIKAQGARV